MYIDDPCLRNHCRSSVWHSLSVLVIIIILMFAFAILFGAFILGPRQEAQVKKMLLSEGITPEAIYTYPHNHSIDLEQAVAASLQGPVSEEHTIAVRAAGKIVVLSVTIKTIKVLSQPAEAQPANQ